MKRLYRFILGHFLPLLLVTLSISLFILLMQFLWMSIADMVGKGVDAGVLAQFFLYISLHLLPTAIPLSVLLASLMAFGNLGEHCELTAMKAAGISLLRIMKPLIVCVVCITVISFVFQNNVQPRARLKMAAIMLSLKQKSPELDIPEGIFYREIDGFNVFVRKKDKKGGLLRDMKIYDYSQGFENAKVILADSGRLKMSEDKKYLVLSLHSGESFENLNTDHVRRANEMIPYRRETFKFRELLISFDANFSMEDESVLGSRADGKNIIELKTFIDSVRVEQDSLNRFSLPLLKRAAYLNTFEPKRYASKSGTRDTLFTNGFQHYFDRLSSEQRIGLLQRAKDKSDQVQTNHSFNMHQQNAAISQLRIYEMQLQSKFALAFSSLLFFFIAAPLGAIIRKGGLGMPAVLSVSLYLTYYTLNEFGTKMARQGVWEVWSGVWFSSSILAVLAFFLTYQAINDSTMFSPDAWKHWWRQTLRRIKRNKWLRIQWKKWSHILKEQWLRIKNRKKMPLICVLLTCLSLNTAAQEPIYKSTMLGVGQASIYDTYLSPLEYTGYNFGLLQEEMRMTGLLGGTIAMQHLFNMNVALSENPTQTSSTYMGIVAYDFGMYRRFEPLHGFQLYAGLHAEALVGGIYNLRNGNNPATAKVHLDLGLSGVAAYQFKIKKQPIKLRYQMNIPALGMFWAPEFGESYYEISTGDAPLELSSFHNYLSMRNILSVELPFNFSTILRLSYVNWMYETRVNQVDTRVHSNTFFIGISQYFTVHPGRSVKPFLP